MYNIEYKKMFENSSLSKCSTKRVDTSSFAKLVLIFYAHKRSLNSDALINKLLFPWESTGMQRLRDVCVIIKCVYVRYMV